MDESNNKVGFILNLAKSLPKRESVYLQALLRDAPLWLFDCLNVQKFKEDEALIRENTPVDRVFILIDGIVKAVDHRIFGIEYDYMRFYPVKLFGSMEILLDLSTYKTTLNAVTSCTCLILTKDKFKKWIEKDINALLMETKAMGSYLLEQGLKERAFLFLNGKDRLFMVFIKNYEHQQEANKKCIIGYTRQELSDFSGISIKTINRSIKKMEEDKFICRRGNKILISKEQYEKMKESIKDIISED